MLSTPRVNRLGQPPRRTGVIVPVRLRRLVPGHVGPPRRGGNADAGSHLGHRQAFHLCHGHERTARARYTQDVPYTARRLASKLFPAARSVLNASSRTSRARNAVSETKTASSCSTV
jgi:hypothetical protein